MKFKNFALVALLTACSTALTAQNSKPNIVYILADDMGVGDISALNPESKISTPELDKLVQNGMTFTDAHTASAVCTPTRYGILTGRYPWRSELKDGVANGYSKRIIKEETDTVGKLLQRAGYTTAMVGKWHLGFDWTFKAGNDSAKLLELKPDSKKLENLVDYTQAFKGGPIDCGFDSFYGMVASPGMPPYTYLEDDKVTVLPTAQQEWFGPRNDFPAGKKLDYERKQQMLRPGLKAPDFTSNKVMLTYTEKSIEFIDKYESKKPFFLYIPYASPHTPVFPREEFLGKSKAGIYGDFVQELDWSVGQIIQSLEAKGFLENTIVIFTADNGWAKGSFPLSFREQFNHNPSRNYNGYKASLLEGGHRVPFIVHWPKTIKTKSQCDTMISTNDLYSTCVAITGSKIAANQGVDSYNMLGLLKGEKEHERNNLVMADYSGKMAIRKGDWKLILNPNPKQRQLFNLAKDVSETANLYNNPEFKSVETELMTEITTLIKKGRSTPGPTQTNDGEPIWKQLYWMK